ncbi:CaiB/BaiF CoA transferase family protein [Microvirga zambiensis]|uniref:CaiB/BaiF CoA transferase family protein n=1 Tax=Microvirga zambiensis TaxID=1402137 RepID=UPI00191D88E6|nr:CoA transferase [Microvirga zambiensis]
MSKLSSFLRGLKVIDVSQYLPGPFASLLLADMGACVLKIEPPTGDEARRFGACFPDGTPAFHEAVNSGKFIALLDLKSEDGRACFLELAAKADVMIEGYRPGVMKKLGLDYPAIRERNPDIIYCSISGYGQDRTNRAGHDGNYLAEAGVLDRNGSSEPVLFDPPPADLAGSFFAATAILGALHGRNRGLGGCHIDLALADCVHPLQIRELAEYAVSGTSPRRGHSISSDSLARNRVYLTGAGYHVAFCALEPKFWEKFCERAGRPAWITRLSDPVPQQALAHEIGSFLLGLSAAELAPLLDDPDLCMSRVYTLEEAVDRASASGRGLLLEKEGRVQALFPAQLDGQAPAPRVAPLSISDLHGVGWESLISSS